MRLHVLQVVWHQKFCSCKPDFLHSSKHTSCKRIVSINVAEPVHRVATWLPCTTEMLATAAVTKKRHGIKRLKRTFATYCGGGVVVAPNRVCLHILQQLTFFKAPFWYLVACIVLQCWVVFTHVCLAYIDNTLTKGAQTCKLLKCGGYAWKQERADGARVSHMQCTSTAFVHSR